MAVVSNKSKRNTMDVSASRVFVVREQRQDTNKLASLGAKGNRGIRVPEEWDNFNKTVLKYANIIWKWRSYIKTLKTERAFTNPEKVRVQNRNRLPFIVDRDCNVLWRRRYLKSANQFRSQERKFYCLDEMWVDESHDTNSVGVDSTVK
jgi:hypothetical protein